MIMAPSVPRILTLLLVAILSAGVCLAQGAVPPQEDTIARMQREIDELRRIVSSLQEQVRALTPVPLPPTAPQEARPTDLPSAPRVAATGTAPSRVFNPAISAVMLGTGNASVNHDRDEDGFALSEAEIGFLADVDPYARVDLFVSFEADGAVEVEEGFATLQALPGGLQAKGGRFKNQFGKWNLLHDHAFFSVDRPDALVSFLGEESLTSDGASLSWLVPGTGSVYLESVTQVGSTGNEISFNADSRDLLYLQHVKSVFTLTPEATLEIGASGAAGKSGASERLIEAIDDAGLSGTVRPADGLASNVFGVDLTYKWKPIQFGVYRSFTWQTELLRSRRRVEALDPGGFLTRGAVGALGGYTHAEYQFAKRFRAGMRYDWSEFPDDDAARQWGVSGVVRIQPSEFQEFRIQFKHTDRNDPAASRFDDIRTDNEIFLQWIPVIGAHAAHPY